nr:hypothetical protein [Bacteroidales bacterium]
MKVLNLILAAWIIFFVFTGSIAQNYRTPVLKSNPQKIDVYYKDIITDNNNVVNKSSEELQSLHQLINDSMLIWSKNYDLKTETGLNNYNKFLIKRINIPAGRKLILSFYDDKGVKEDFNLINLGRGKLEFEKTNDLIRDK